MQMPTISIIPFQEGSTLSLDFTSLRNTMVQTQLVPNHVLNPRILKAFREVQREKFLPIALQPLAYCDQVLKILEGQFMITPLMLGRLAEALNPHESDSILVVGDVTGYTSALFSMLCGGVVSLIPETIPESHVKHLKKTLNTYAHNPVLVKKGPLEKGAPDHAPYTHLFFEGSIPSFPNNLLEALNTHGRAVAIIQKNAYLGHAMLYKKFRQNYEDYILFEGALPPIHEFQNFSSYIF